MMPSCIAERKGKPRRFGKPSRSACRAADWSSIRRRRRSSIARMISGGEHTRTRSSIFWAIRFGRGDRRIARGSSSSISVRQSRTRRRRRSGSTFEAGICLCAVINRSKICRGCSIRLSEAGFNTTGGFTGRRSIRRCAQLDRDLGPVGRAEIQEAASASAQGDTLGRAHFAARSGVCLRTGRWGCGVAPWWEPYEPRGSSTVLREPRGEIPRGYSPDYAILLLLVTYGLRAHEVARLTLDDVDWKSERLKVLARKAGHATVYPLAGVVAEAIIDYQIPR